MTGEQALLFLEDLRERVAIVTPSEEDYLSTITSAVTADIIGGAIYDALIACCAIRSDSEMIYTWNVADFRRLGPDIAKRVRTP
jgi:predicted nucleic acid-binding protein